MDWNIQHNPGAGILQVVATGTLTLPEVETMAVAVLQRARALGCPRILCDYRRVTVNASVAAVYDFPDALKALGVGPEYRIANVAPTDPDALRLFRLFDDRSFFGGLNQQLFTEADAALDWLIRG